MTVGSSPSVLPPQTGADGREEQEETVREAVDRALYAQALERTERRCRSLELLGHRIRTHRARIEGIALDLARHG